MIFKYNYDYIARTLYLRVITGESAVGFMNYYVNTNGEINSEDGRIVLPIGITVKSMYEKYAESHSDDALSLSHFHRLWRENFHHVSQQKVRPHIYHLRS